MQKQINLDLYCYEYVKTAEVSNNNRDGVRDTKRKRWRQREIQIQRGLRGKGGGGEGGEGR